jgi:SAM-dependent methyltransferase
MGRMVRLGYRLNKIANRIITGKKAPDDYDWKYYTGIYREGLEDFGKENVLVLKEGDYRFEGGTLERKGAVLPLNDNHRIVYETLLQLKPGTVFEVGCGCGDHLHNLKVLDPGIGVYGIDISEGQLDFLKQRHPTLGDSVRQYNITVPLKGKALPEADIVFSQAVIMHIRENHLVGLENMFLLARRQVVLMENWKRHEFMDDIKSLFDGKRLPWENVYFHYRNSSITGKPHLMIISRSPLPQYPVLDSYDLLKDTVGKI